MPPLSQKYIINWGAWDGGKEKKKTKNKSCVMIIVFVSLVIEKQNR